MLTLPALKSCTYDYQFILYFYVCMDVCLCDVLWVMTIVEGAIDGALSVYYTLVFSAYCVVLYGIVLRCVMLCCIS